jgi:hypothetical protein
MATRKRTDGGCTPIVENKFIPKTCKWYKVQVEMTIKRVIEVELFSDTPRAARRWALSSGTLEARGARDLQESAHAELGELGRCAKYKVIGVAPVAGPDA